MGHGDERPAVRFHPGERFANLRIERELGVGAFGTVYEAWDAIIDRPVVLKVVSRPAEPEREDETRGLKEARLVGTLQSPHVVTLYQVHPLGDQAWALEMEHVDGGTLGDLLASRGRLPPLEAVHILRGVLGALKSAHDHGVLHRDVKPSNVLLGRGGAVKLTDFGLGGWRAGARLHENGRTAPTGTPLYMAPEVIMGEQAGPAADLWSAGVLAYVMLTGRTPYTGRDLPSLFLALQNADPSSLDADVPAELASVVMHCLSRHPEDRPASAADMLANVDRVEASLRRRLNESSATEAPLTGREAEQDRLDEALSRAKAGHGTTLVVTGGAGLGKTTVLRHLAQRARSRGFQWVEASLSPVGGLRTALLGALRKALGERTESGAPPTPMHPRPTDSTITRLLDLAVRTTPDDQRSHEQLVWTLERLIKALASKRPVVLFIEEARHCAEDCLRVLTDLTVRTGKSRVLIAIAYRTDDAVTASGTLPKALRELVGHRGVVHVGLTPLSSEALYRRLEDEVSPLTLDAEVAKLILGHAEGNPLYALELLRHLEEVGGIVRSATHLRPGPQWGRTALPEKFHDLVAERLAGLSETERSLLDAAAVDGVDFDGGAVAAVAELPLLSVLRVLQRLYREHGLVVPLPNGFRFAHPLTREVIYGQIVPELRREIHRRLALHLESREDDDSEPERLGLHWEQAGLPDRAAPWLRKAALDACRRREPQRAVAIASRAGLLSREGDPARDRDDADLLLAVSSCLIELEQYAEAQRVVARVLDAADDESVRLQAIVRREELAYASRGSAATSMADLARATGGLPDSDARGRAYLLRGILLRDAGNLASARDVLALAEKLFVRLDLRSLRATTLGALASVARRMGHPEEAESLFAEAARIAKLDGHRTSAAVSEVNRSISALSRGALVGLAPRLESAIRALTLTGATDQAARAGAVLAQVYYASGDAPLAERVTERVRRTLEKREHHPGLVRTLPLEAHLRAIRGDVEGALRLCEKAREAAESCGDLRHQVATAALEAQVSCFSGGIDRARAAALRACRLAWTGFEIRCRARLALRLAESVVYGLPSDALAEVFRLIPDGASVPGPILHRAREALDGAMALGRPDGPPEAIRSMAAAYARPDIGERHAEYEILAGLLRSMAARRSGQASEARGEARTALEGAERLGHVWLRLALMRELRRDGEDDTPSTRLEDLLQAVEDQASDPGVRKRLREVWS